MREKKGNRVRLVLNQLSESEESDVEENKTEKAAPSSGRKYIPPKIAPMHYGKVTFLCFIIVVMVKLVLIFISSGIRNLSLNLPECRKPVVAQNTKPESRARAGLPRIKAVVHSDGDMTDADRKKAQAERQRRAALRSSVIQELRQQYSDAPEEIREKRDFQTERDSREELHRRVLPGLAFCVRVSFRRHFAICSAGRTTRSP